MKYEIQSWKEKVQTNNWGGPPSSFAKASVLCTPSWLARLFGKQPYSVEVLGEKDQYNNTHTWYYVETGMKVPIDYTMRFTPDLHDVLQNEAKLRKEKQEAKKILAKFKVVK